MRALCYSTKLIGGLSKNEIRAKRFAAFSSQMSNARAVLRLLDDLPMLQYTIEYGLGKHVSSFAIIIVPYNMFFIIF